MTHPASLPPVPRPQAEQGWTGTILGILVLVLIVVVGAFFYFKGTKGAEKVKKAAPEIPVQASAVTRGDLKIFLNGLGTATALNTVTVRTRIDGQINKIAFTEGQTVKEGDPVVEIDPRPYEVQLTQAQGQLAKDQASLENAKLDLKRYQNAGEAVPEQQAATAASTVAQFEGAVKIDQGQIDNAKLNLIYCHITAPISGRIGLRLVDQGNMVHATDATGLLVITQVKPIAVIFSLSQDELPKVLKAIQEKKQLDVDAYDRDLKNKLSTGTLLAVDNQIDTTTATVRFKAVFPNDDEMLFPNQFVNIRLLIDIRKDVTLAPSAAIQHNPTTAFVYVVKPDDTVEIRTVTTGPTEGTQTVVEKGLEPDDQVVTDGVDKLQNGSKVSLRTHEPAKGDTQKSDAPKIETPKIESAR